MHATDLMTEIHHQPLQYLKKTTTESGRLSRWALQLQPYSYQLRLMKGSVNYGINVRGKPFESFKVNVRVKLELKA